MFFVTFIKTPHFESVFLVIYGRCGKGVRGLLYCDLGIAQALVEARLNRDSGGAPS